MPVINWQRLSLKTIKRIKDIGRLADKGFGEAYLVGGMVRDLLLNRSSLDLDILVEGHAVNLAKQWAKNKRSRIVVHKAFQTATVYLSSGESVDFTTARTERYPHPGALPVVRPGKIHDDLLRRDFTINALAIQINPEDFGELVDEWGGVADLEEKLIRVMHDKSFHDDPTRLLRTVRFEQRLGFKIEPHTLSLVKEAIIKNYHQSVKPSRYFAEFKKILNEEKPEKAIQRLDRLGGLKKFLKVTSIDYSPIKRISRRKENLGQKAYAQSFKKWWLVYLLALTGKMSARMTKVQMDRFQLSRSDQNVFLGQKRFQVIERNLQKKGLKKSEIYSILHPLSQEVVIFLRVATQSAEVGKRIDAFLLTGQAVRLQINGDDLKKLGLKGKRIRAALEYAMRLKMDGRIKTRRDELNAVKSWMK